MEILVIIGCLLLIGFRGFRKMKAAFSDWEASTGPKSDSSQSAFEQMCADENEVKEKVPSFGDEEREAGYFSYECASELAAEKDASASHTFFGDAIRRSRESVNMASVEKPGKAEDDNTDDSGLDFDLRQAVIHQTILSNPYQQRGCC